MKVEKISINTYNNMFPKRHTNLGINSHIAFGSSSQDVFVKSIFNDISDNIKFDDINTFQENFDSVREISETENLPVFQDEYQQLRKSLLLPLFSLKAYSSCEPKDFIISSNNLNNVNYLVDKFGNKITHNKTINYPHSINSMLPDNFEEKPVIMYIPDAYRTFSSPQIIDEYNSIKSQAPVYFILSTKYPEKLIKKIEGNQFNEMKLPDINSENVSDILDFYIEKLQTKAIIKGRKINTKDIDKQKIIRALCNYKGIYEYDIQSLIKILEITNTQYLLGMENSYETCLNKNIEHYAKYGGI